MELKSSRTRERDREPEREERVPVKEKSRNRDAEKFVISGGALFAVGLFFAGFLLRPVVEESLGLGDTWKRYLSEDLMKEVKAIDSSCTLDGVKGMFRDKEAAKKACLLTIGEDSILGKDQLSLPMSGSSGDGNTYGANPPNESSNEPPSDPKKPSPPTDLPKMNFTEDPDGNKR